MDVYAMCNMHNTSVTMVLKRLKGCRNKVPTPCPSIIADYNVNMGGVDLTDQHLSHDKQEGCQMVEKSILEIDRYVHP